MQITIKIPMVTRSWFIIAFLAFMWGMVGKLIYDGYQTDINENQQVVALATDKYVMNNGNGSVNRMISFTLQDGSNRTKSINYTAAAYDEMQVGVRYVLNVEVEKTFYMTVSWIAWQIVFVFGIILFVCAAFFAGYCGIYWTIDLINRDKFRTITQILNS